MQKIGWSDVAEAHTHVIGSRWWNQKSVGESRQALEVCFERCLCLRTDNWHPANRPRHSN